MELIRIPRVMRDTVIRHLFHGKTIGFVPTMGALHEGHLSLVRRAKQENDITAVSIFVNPIQFGPSEDYSSYPRDLEGDTAQLQQEEVDILFMPDIALMYPGGFLTHVDVDVISDRLCGAFRPGHFRGVATVVTKLFHIVKPTRAYFGQKDFQQTLVIRKLVRDLDMDIDIVICPTVRERDGLAMSSRNAYLNTEQREAAAVIYSCLTKAAGSIQSGIINSKQITDEMQETLLRVPAVSQVEYAGLYDPETLEEIPMIQDNVLLAVAIRIGNTRLIDNIVVSVRKER